MTLMMAKNHLRVAESITDDDDYIRALIAASVPVAENMTNRSLMLQSWALYLDEFPKNNCPIELPFPPLRSVTAVTYTDLNGQAQTLATTEYQVDDKSIVGMIALKSGKTWPETQEEGLNSVRINFTCGYLSPEMADPTEDDKANMLPKAIRQALMLLIGTWYDKATQYTSFILPNMIHNQLGIAKMMLSLSFLRYPVGCVSCWEV